ncbi:hypothetical protein KUTeg_023754 [Tegillarca granosa]|uniref:Tripartite motif-containing protein 2 n=1 Tax=Tegillarca granosa TaxID=220873 RepID=A0ABQ9E2Z3_TEGGR|nr:hypothetical protein KUTeg_023754 [Tegillarca granosa]
MSFGLIKVVDGDTSDNDFFHTEPVKRKSVKDVPASPKPLCPYCLCLSSDGHILVTMYDQLSHDVNKTSKRLVTRMTTIGQILITYEYDNDKRLFILPLGIDENTNKDICVVNNSSIGSGHVVILNASGRLKCRYKDRKCDKFGQIVVSDLNKKIHVLNRNGQLIKYLMTDKDLQDYPFS